MPMNARDYPPDWKQISKDVRRQAGNRCERCGVKNGAVIVRSVDGKSWYDPDKDGYFEYPSGHRLPDCFEADLRDKDTKIVLTVAHVGPAKHDKMNCLHLEALCQACHLAEDLQDRIANRKASRMDTEAAGSLFSEQETSCP